jgi:hypothetical protein
LAGMAGESIFFCPFLAGGFNAYFLKKMANMLVQGLHR